MTLGVIMFYSSSIDSPNLFVIEPSNPAYCSSEDLCQLIASSSQELWKNLHGCGAVLLRDFDLKSSEDFEQVALSLFPTTLAAEYPGGAPREK